MKRISSILLALALVLGFSLVVTTPVAAAATINVNSSMTTTQINAAIAGAGSGDTVQFANGTYSLAAPLVVGVAGVILQGDITTPSNVVVNAPTSGTDRDCFQVRANNVTIQGFKMQGAKDAASGAGWQNAGVMVGNDGSTLMSGSAHVGLQNTTISHNEIRDCSYGIYHYRAQHTTISYNKIHGCTIDEGHWTGKGIELYGEGASTNPQNYDVDILNNEIYDNKLMGIELNHTDVSGLGVGVFLDVDVLIDGNKIHSNGGNWGGVGYDLDIYRGISANGYEEGVTISDNEIYNHWTTTAKFNDSSAGIRCLYGKNWEISDNDIHDNLNGINIYEDSESTAITGNDIYDNARGIKVGTFGGTTGGGSGDVGYAHLNNIYGNNVNTYAGNGVDPYGVINAGTGTFGATYNWWGANDGPGGVGPGSGDTVSANVLFLPWACQPTTGGQAYLTPSNGMIDDLTPVSTPPNPPATFPYGMFTFKITGLSTGEEVTLTIELPGPMPVGTKWWKYHNNTWSPMDIGSDDGDNVITVALKDGRTPDDEDLVNGQITDQGGPASPTVGWETYPVSKVHVFLPWIALLAAIAAGASLLVVRRRRAQN